MIRPGYGIIHKSVMQDHRISIKAKALYAYLCSYAGNTAVAFPSVALTCRDLGITKTSYYKYREELVKAGHITVERQRGDRDKFKNNIYRITLTMS